MSTADPLLLISILSCTILSVTVRRLIVGSSALDIRFCVSIVFLKPSLILSYRSSVPLSTSDCLISCECILTHSSWFPLFNFCTICSAIGRLMLLLGALSTAVCVIDCAIVPTFVFLVVCTLIWLFEP